MESRLLLTVIVTILESWQRLKVNLHGGPGLQVLTHPHVLFGEPHNVSHSYRALGGVFLE